MSGRAGAIGVLAVLTVYALLFPLFAHHDPTDLAQLHLGEALRPPAWSAGGGLPYLLGSDAEGRDLAAAIAHGLRTSIAVGLAAVAVGLAIGVPVGLFCGYFGGLLDGALMRLADLQLAYPAVLMAILLDGIGRAALGSEQHTALAVPVVVLAIGLSFWVHIARAVRSLVAVERSKDYVAAAILGGVPRRTILFRHILPGVAAPIFVLATVDCAAAVAAEATLGFLGLGLPPSLPSLGTLIRNGADFLLAGAWWLIAFPAGTLVALVAALNRIGDAFAADGMP